MERLEEGFRVQHGGVWILVEQSGGTINQVSFELCRRGIDLAGGLGVGLTAVILGNGLPDRDIIELIYHGANYVLAVEHIRLERFIAEAYAIALTHVISEFRPEILLAAATTTGRTVMPYVAVRLGTGLTADCTELAIESDTRELLQTRPAIGGNILATIKTLQTRPRMATVRPRSTKPTPRDSGRTGEIVRLALPDRLFSSVRSRWLGSSLDPTQEVALQESDTVVAGGRGLGKSQNMALLHDLAAALNAAVGASRDIVDRGWIGYPHQVGLSGKTVSPRLYMAIGISGSVQHIAGMQTAGTIVAINNDPNAQIFRLADFGLVGDLHEIVPVLIGKLAEREVNHGGLQKD